MCVPSIAPWWAASINCRDATQGPQIFREQLKLGLPLSVDEVTVTLAFKSCCGDAVLAGQVHGFAVASGFSCFTSFSNLLMGTYFKGGEFGCGICLFESMEDHDVVTWNAAISGCKTSEDALSFGVRMNSSGVAFGAVSYTALLAFCAGYEGLLFGLQLHCMAMKFGIGGEVFVGNALVSLYAKHDKTIDAGKAFDGIPIKDVSHGMRCYLATLKDGMGTYGQDILHIFLEMVKGGWRLDHISLMSAVSACGHERNIEIGRQIHGLVLKGDMPSMFLSATS